MIQRKTTFYLGLFIFLIPFLGLPSIYKTILIIVSGLTLLSLSVKLTLPKKGATGIQKEQVVKENKDNV